MNYETVGDKIIFYSLGNFIFDTDYQRSQFNTELGLLVKINFTDISVSSNINKLTKDDIENASYNNKLFYRNAANVTMNILCGEKKISENRIKINQLGNVSLIPINKTKLTFDVNTGQVLSIIKD